MTASEATTDTMPTSGTTAVARLSDEQRATFWSAGFLHVRDALPESLCDAVTAAMWDRLEAAGAPRQGQFTELPNFMLAPAFARTLAPPAVIGLVIDLMGEHVRLMSSQHVIRFPDKAPEVWHADGAQQPGGWSGYPESMGTGPLMQLKAAYALHDLRAAGSGTTQLVPGSHLRPNREVRGFTVANPPPGATAPALAKGDAFLFHQGIWHCPGAIEGDQPRLMLFNAYCHMWARPFDYEDADLDPAVLEPLTPAERRLVAPFGAGAEVRQRGGLYSPYYSTPPASLAALLGMAPAAG
jgi:hypothetical protein